MKGAQLLLCVFSALCMLFIMLLMESRLLSSNLNFDGLIYCLIEWRAVNAPGLTHLTLLHNQRVSHFWLSNQPLFFSLMIPKNHYIKISENLQHWHEHGLDYWAHRFAQVFQLFTLSVKFFFPKTFAPTCSMGSLFFCPLLFGIRVKTTSSEIVNPVKMN